MKALVLLCALVLGFSSVAWAQYPFFDNHSNFLAKQFQKGKNTFLEVHTDSLPERWHRGLERLDIPLERPTEGAWSPQRPANYRFSHQFLNTVEGQWQDAAIVDQKYGWPSLAAWKGFPLNWLSETEEQASFPVAYFDSIVHQLFVLKAHQQKIEDDYAKEKQLLVCNDRTDLIQLQRHPERMGLFLSIEGGHNLGDYGYIQRQETHRPEYKAQVLENIAILKGVKPFVYQGQEHYLPYTIASVQLASYFDNGLCGNSRPENRKLEKYIGAPITRGFGMSPLGKEVVRSLLDASKGYRILVDVSGMSVAARKWYYDYLKQLNYSGAKVPVLWSQAALSGKSWREADYLEGSQELDAFFHHPSQLAREDLNAIFESRGLISLSLRAEHLLSKTRFKEAYAEVKGKKEQEEALLVQATALQVCRIIHILQDKAAWNRISLSTGFDSQDRPFPTLQKVSDLSSFAKSLEAFFENPTDILDIYTAAQVKQFMYGQSPKQLVAKLLHDNAQLFWQEQLPRDFQAPSNSTHWRANR